MEVLNHNTTLIWRHVFVGKEHISVEGFSKIISCNNYERDVDINFCK